MANSNYNPPIYGYQYPRASTAQPMYGGFPQFGTPQQISPGLQNGTGGSAGPNPPGMLPTEQSYIENILRLNKGKLVTLYATFENNKEKVFNGLIEAAGRDHVILSDPQTGDRYLIPMVYLDYITFSEEIEYEYPYGGGAGLATYPPR